MFVAALRASADAAVRGVMVEGLVERVGPVWRQPIEGDGIKLKVEGLIAEGNVVAVRYVESGAKQYVVHPYPRGEPGA